LSTRHCAVDEKDPKMMDFAAPRLALGKLVIGIRNVCQLPLTPLTATPAVELSVAVQLDAVSSSTRKDAPAGPLTSTWT
jgi:hypothetical protein